MGGVFDKEDNGERQESKNKLDDVDDVDDVETDQMAINANQNPVDMPGFEWTKDKDVTQSLEFEKWYHILSDHTMKSFIIDCSKEEISAIKDACDVHRDEVIDTEQSKLSSKVEQILNLFAVKIQKYIDENHWNEQGIFVRFSQSLVLIIIIIKL